MPFFVSRCTIRKQTSHYSHVNTKFFPRSLVRPPCFCSGRARVFFVLFKVHDDWLRCPFRLRTLTFGQHSRRGEIYSMSSVAICSGRNETRTKRAASFVDKSATRAWEIVILFRNPKPQDFRPHQGHSEVNRNLSVCLYIIISIDRSTFQQSQRSLQDHWIGSLKTTFGSLWEYFFVRCVNDSDWKISLVSVTLRISLRLTSRVSGWLLELCQLGDDKTLLIRPPHLPCKLLLGYSSLLEDRWSKQGETKHV